MTPLYSFSFFSHFSFSLPVGTPFFSQSKQSSTKTRLSQDRTLRQTHAHTNTQGVGRNRECLF